MNSANLIGRLTRDPELRYTANNFPVCTFSVAIDRRGKEEKKTNYIPVKVLGKLAHALGLAAGKDAVAQYNDFETTYWNEAGCTVSCDCGPGTLGVQFVRK